MDIEDAELYFSGWGFDSRKNEEYEEYDREEGGEVTVITIGKRALVARPLGGHALFREVEDADERAAWFLTQPLTEDEFDESNYLDKKWFTQQWKQGGFGRCILYVAPYMTRWQCAHMLFRPDGTGLAVDTFENPLVEFAWKEATPLSWPELMDADPNDLQPLCASIFDSQVNGCIANAYLAPLGLSPADYVDVPHRFECGSEEELRRLTTAILHSHPGLFENEKDAVTIKYRAKTANKRAFMAVLYKRYNAKPVTHLGRLQSLCDLALRLNTFVGETWSHWMETPTRKGDFEKEMHKIFVEAPPPSQHERAESLLMLADWLDGKVRPEKRLRLLMVDDADNAGAAE